MKVNWLFFINSNYVLQGRDLTQNKKSCFPKNVNNCKSISHQFAPCEIDRSQLCLSSEMTGYFRWYNFLGQHLVILSFLEVITDLFEKRSSNYSDRQQMTMLNELYVSHSFFFTLQRTCQNLPFYARMDLSRISIAFMPVSYGLWWRKHRKLFHEYFHRNRWLNTNLFCGPSRLRGIHESSVFYKTVC